MTDPVWKRRNRCRAYRVLWVKICRGLSSLLLCARDYAYRIHWIVAFLVLYIRSLVPVNELNLVTLFLVFYGHLYL